jgi:hypothetical protein
VRLLRYPVLLLIASPALGSLIPALLWLVWIGSSGRPLLGLILVSLVATARIAMRLLDRLRVNGMWVRLGWTIAATVVGIAIWGPILHAGGASSG